MNLSNKTIIYEFSVVPLHLLLKLTLTIKKGIIVTDQALAPTIQIRLHPV
jgi:hypothetical protein